MDPRFPDRIAYKAAICAACPNNTHCKHHDPCDCHAHDHLCPWCHMNCQHEWRVDVDAKPREGLVAEVCDKCGTKQTRRVQS